MSSSSARARPDVPAHRGGDPRRSNRARGGVPRVPFYVLRLKLKAETLARKGVFRLARNREDFEPAIWNREARSKLPGMLARVDAPDGVGGYGKPRLNRWQCIFAALGDWSSVSALASRSETLLRDRSERFWRFCRDCREDTPHEGF